MCGRKVHVAQVVPHIPERKFHEDCVGPKRRHNLVDAGQLRDWRQVSRRQVQPR